MKFTIENIPFGIFSTKGTKKRVGTIYNSQVIDLAAVAKLGYFDALKVSKAVFGKPFLNNFIALGKAKTNTVRSHIQTLLRENQLPSEVFIPENEVIMHLPVQIGDYTDFYSSEQHATNVGMMFRDPANALLPNWKHIPVGYHGRASSIFVSGTNFHRPKGQVCADESKPPVFTASGRLDIELEVATIIGKPNKIGESIKVNKAEDYVFGFVLFNDWSARDIQKWEYVPLGPFLAKNFFSSVSPWIVTIEALENFRVEVEPQIPKVLPYLNEKNRRNFDVQLEVSLITKEGAEKVICRSNFKNMYWSVAQQIAHHTVNGCNMNVGDMLASGTISGKEAESFGSLLELTWGGKYPIEMPDGTVRRFLEDGDTIIIRGFAEKDGQRIDFGEVRNTVLPAKK